METGKIVFNDEITVYFDRQPDLNGGHFLMFADQKEILKSNKTHFSYMGLNEDTEYFIEIKMYDANGSFVRSIFEEKIRTKKTKKKIDISSAPYLAKGDGETLNTEAIQKALDDCTKDDFVYVPEGTFLTGALNLHSDTELVIDGVLQGSENPDDYLPKIKSRYEGIERMCFRSLINMGELDRNTSKTCENIIIRGKGMISGGGTPLGEAMKDTEIENVRKFKEIEGRPVTPENERDIAGVVRGRLINISSSENVIISGLKLYKGPAWNVHFIYSKNIITYNCSFNSKKVGNGDGWDPDSSENCVLFGCDFDTGDDIVAIKSGKNPEGDVIAKPAKNIYVFDCTSEKGGALAIGSEMSGGVSDVFIWDCDVSKCAGFHIKAQPQRGGYVRNIHISDCITPRLWLLSSVAYNQYGIPSPDTPVFENFYFENIKITNYGIAWKQGYINCTGLRIIGFDKKGYEIRNVHLKNITLAAKPDNSPQEVEITHANNIVIENLISE